MSQRVQEILLSVKTLASEYYSLTGKPLGVTGEVAEHAAAQLLGLELVSARTEGHDALRHTAAGFKKIQIKGRALGVNAKLSQRLGTIKKDADCDIVMLVLLDVTTLDATEIWEASMSEIRTLLAKPGSKSRERGALGIAAFKKVASRIWPVIVGSG